VSESSVNVEAAAGDIFAVGQVVCWGSDCGA
jgi:hypothetical protein